MTRRRIVLRKSCKIVDDTDRYRAAMRWSVSWSLCPVSRRDVDGPATMSDVGTAKRVSKGLSYQREIRATLFGGLALHLDSNPLEHRLSCGTRALVTMLLIQPDRPRSREALAERLWPGLSPDMGRRRLSQALWQITRRLNDVGLRDFFDNSAASVGLSARYEIRSDVQDFEQLIDEAESVGEDAEGHLALLEEAVSLYSGEFLEGCYDDWSIDTRHRLHARYRTALASLVRGDKAGRRLALAASRAHTLVRSDPTDEDAYCEAMRIACLRGRPGEARDLYWECVRQLDVELGVEPTRTTRELFESIIDAPVRLISQRSSSSAQLTAAASIAPFVGRDGERAVFLEHVDRMIEGSGGVLLIEGEAGVGKSRLIAECVDGALWRGATVLQGGHRDSRGLRPFSGLIQALQPSLSGLRGQRLDHIVEAQWISSTTEILQLGSDRNHAPDQRMADANKLRAVTDVDNELRWLRCEGLVQVLVGQGLVGPTVVVLDDVQWIDDDSIEVLVQLAGRLAEARVLLVLSYRRDVALRNRRLWHALRLLERGDAHRVSLGSIGSTEARTLARWALGDHVVDEHLLGGVADAVGGNPLYIIETARAVARRGQHRWRTLPVPSSVADIIAQRIVHLDAPVVLLLATLAVANSRLRIDDLASLMSVPRAELLRSLATTIDAGFVVERDECFGFDHELVRRGVYTTLSAATRRDLHERIAELLGNSQERDVAELAEHSARAGNWDAAFAHYRSAAEQALTAGAFVSSKRNYERARRSHAKARLNKASLTKLLLDYEVLLDLLSERRRQETVLTTLSALARDEYESIEVLRRRAGFAASIGDFDQAISAAREAVERADAAGVLRAESCAALGWTLIGAGRALEAIESLEHATSLADSPSVEASAHCALGRAFTMVQDLTSAEHHLRQALVISESEGHQRGEIDALASLGALAIERGDHARAQDDLNRAITMADAVGYRRGAAVSLVNLASMYAMSGRSGRSLACYDAALERFRVVHEARGEAMVLANRATIRLRLQGELISTTSDVRRANRYFVAIGDERNQANCLDTLANIHRRSRRVAAARRTLARARELAERTADRWYDVQIRRSTAMLELEAGRPLVALDAVRTARSLSELSRLGGVMPSLLAIEARALLACEEPAAALELAQSARLMLADNSDLAPYVALWAAQVLDVCGAPSSTIATLAIEAHRLLRRELSGLDTVDRVRAMSSTADHRAIVELVTRFVPSKVFVDVPRRRRDASESHRGEMASVEVTITHPDDHPVATKTTRRRVRLLRIVTEIADAGCAPRVSDLASILDVSAATVKRDLSALRDGGHRVDIADSTR